MTPMSYPCYTLVELAERIGIVQARVSDYAQDKLQLNAEMLVRRLYRHRCQANLPALPRFSGHRRLW